MSEFRLVKTRWYHRLLDKFFKPSEPSGFQFGQLRFNLYVTDKGIEAGFPTRENIKTINTDYLPSKKVQRHTMHEQEGSVPTELPITLEDDSKGITR